MIHLSGDPNVIQGWTVLVFLRAAWQRRMADEGGKAALWLWSSRSERGVLDFMRLHWEWFARPRRVDTEIHPRRNDTEIQEVRLTCRSLSCVTLIPIPSALQAR